MLHDSYQTTLTTALTSGFIPSIQDHYAEVSSSIRTVNPKITSINKVKCHGFP